MAEQLEKTEMARGRGQASQVMRKAKVMWGLLGVLAIIGVAATSWAQTPDSSSNTGFQTGQVVSTGDKHMVIDHKSYAVSSEVKVTDDEGGPREYKQVGPDQIVMFHLKKGQIDQLIIVLPK